MNIDKKQLESAVRTLLYQDKYKPLSPHIGGWFWTTEAVWTVLETFKSLGLASLEAVALTALSVPAQSAQLLAEFIADLFQVLSIIADEASDIPADAEEFGQSPEGQVLLGILAPEQLLMGKFGIDDRTLRALAGVLNPSPIAAKLGAAAMKNTADASIRIARAFSGSRTRR